MRSRRIGAGAGWQHGFSERHGGLLGHAWHALIWQYQAKGKEEMPMPFKERIKPSRGEASPRTRSSFPDLLEEDSTGNLALQESLSTEGEVQRSAEMRAAAKLALMRQDCQDKLKTALRRWPPGNIKFIFGEMVFFYAPKATAKRFRREGGAWRGPAVVLMKESGERYYISWRGRCLLVAAPNLRMCSELEGGDFKGWLAELDHFEKKWDGDEEFEDMTQVEVPPEEGDKIEIGWVPQEEVIVQKPGRWKKQKAKEIAKSLEG